MASAKAHTAGGTKTDISDDEKCRVRRISKTALGSTVRSVTFHGHAPISKTALSKEAPEFLGSVVSSVCRRSTRCSPNRSRWQLLFSRSCFTWRLPKRTCPVAGHWT